MVLLTIQIFQHFMLCRSINNFRSSERSLCLHLHSQVAQEKYNANSLHSVKYQKTRTSKFEFYPQICFGLYGT